MTNNTNTHADKVAAIKALCEQSRAAKAAGTTPTTLLFPPGFTDEQKQAAANLVAGAEQAYGAALGAGKTRTFLASRLPAEAMAAIDAYADATWAATIGSNASTSGGNAALAAVHEEVKADRAAALADKKASMRNGVSPLSVLELIEVWREGCGNTLFDENGKRIDQAERPGLCEGCTVALIEAIERKEIAAKGGAQ